MDKYDALIKKARDILKTAPLDGVHDLSHHLSVLKTANQIAENIGHNFDQKTLELAVMWHDVHINAEVKDSFHSAELVRSEMIELGFSEKEISEVYNAVAYHSFEQQPKNMIGKILYDADKLDLLSLPRWKNGLKMETSGKASFKQAKQVPEHVVKLIPALPEKLHF